MFENIGETWKTITDPATWQTAAENVKNYASDVYDYATKSWNDAVSSFGQNWSQGNYGGAILSVPGAFWKNLTSTSSGRSVVDGLFGWTGRSVASERALVVNQDKAKEVIDALQRIRIVTIENARSEVKQALTTLKNSKGVEYGTSVSTAMYDAEFDEMVEGVRNLEDTIAAKVADAVTYSNTPNGIKAFTSIVNLAARSVEGFAKGIEDFTDDGCRVVGAAGKFVCGIFNNSDAGEKWANFWNGMADKDTVNFQGLYNITDKYAFIKSDSILANAGYSASRVTGYVTAVGTALAVAQSRAVAKSVVASAIFGPAVVTAVSVAALIPPGVKLAVNLSLTTLVAYLILKNKKNKNQDTDPKPTDPDPGNTDPKPTDPDPGDTDPKPTDPDPGDTDPKPTDPDPDGGDNGKTDPKPDPTDPKTDPKTDPRDTDPITQPSDTDPKPTDPIKTDPQPGPSTEPREVPSGGNGQSNGGGNSSLVTNEENGETETTPLDDLEDDIIKEGKTYKIPTSSKTTIKTPTSSTSGGNSVIPVLAGLSAAAAAGIGAKAYLDKKNEDDDDDDEIKTEDWSTDSDVEIEYQEPVENKEETLEFDDDYGYETEEPEKYGAKTHQELEDLQ